jgi:hypothetical protein
VILAYIVIHGILYFVVNLNMISSIHIWQMSVNFIETTGIIMEKEKIQKIRNRLKIGDIIEIEGYYINILRDKVKYIVTELNNCYCLMSSCRVLENLECNGKQIVFLDTFKNEKIKSLCLNYTKENIPEFKNIRNIKVIKKDIIVNIDKDLFEI